MIDKDLFRLDLEDTYLLPGFEKPMLTFLGGIIDGIISQHTKLNSNGVLQLQPEYDIQNSQSPLTDIQKVRNDVAQIIGLGPGQINDEVFRRWCELQEHARNMQSAFRKLGNMRKDAQDGLFV